MSVKRFVSNIECRKISCPEEIIRQRCISYMIQKGYPKHFIAIEKSLTSFPHLKGMLVPNRKIDIICFASIAQCGFSPLILLECKANKLCKRAFHQILGYNYYVQANFIAVVGLEKIFVMDKACQKKWNDLPLYVDLLKLCTK